MSEKLNQQLEQQDLEAMADQLLAEDAAKREEEDSKSRKKLDDKTIAALPAATLITANEKLKDLLAKGCKTGKLDPGELSDVVDTMDLDGDQMDRIYDSLADLGIEVGSDEFLTDLPDDGEPASGGDRRDRGRGAGGPQHAGGQLQHRRPRADVSEGDRQGAAADGG